MLTGGLGTQIATFIIENDYENKLRRIGINDEYIEHGDVNLLLEYRYLKANIKSVAKSIIKNNYKQMNNYDKRTL